MLTRLLARLKSKHTGVAPTAKVHDFTYQHEGHTLGFIKLLEDGTVFLNGDSVKVNAGDLVLTRGRNWVPERYRLFKVKHFPNGTWRAYARPEHRLRAVVRSQHGNKGRT